MRTLAKHRLRPSTPVRATGCTRHQPTARTPPREICLFSSLAAVAAPLASAGATGTAAAVVDLSATKQPIRCFGTSLCWWAIGVGGGRNATAFEQYMDALFHEPAKHGELGLNQVRYSTAGSDTAVGDAHFLRAGGFGRADLPAGGRQLRLERRRDAAAGGGRREASRQEYLTSRTSPTHRGGGWPSPAPPITART